MPANEHAYEALKGLRTALRTARVNPALADASEALLTAGNELMFYQDSAVAKVGREMVDIGQRMAGILDDLGKTEARIAGLL